MHDTDLVKNKKATLRTNWYFPSPYIFMKKKKTIEGWGSPIEGKKKNQKLSNELRMKRKMSLIKVRLFQDWRRLKK